MVEENITTQVSPLVENESDVSEEALLELSNNKGEDE